MATLANVEDALTYLIQDIVYPSGPTQPSVLGKDIRIFRGWPKFQDLERDLNANVVTISVFGKPDSTKNVTKYLPEWQVKDEPVHTVTIALDLDGGFPRVTLNGTLPIQQILTVVVGMTEAFSHVAMPGDTLDDAAFALSELIATKFTVSVAGAAITIETGQDIKAKVGGHATMWREVRRQHQDVMITVWCKDPVDRDAVIEAVDEVMATKDYLTCADTTNARILYGYNHTQDETQNVGLYRATLGYWVEYPTMQTTSATEVTVVEYSLGVASAPSSVFYT